MLVMAHVWMSVDNSVELVLDFHLSEGNGDQSQATRALPTNTFTHEAISLALKDVFLENFTQSWASWKSQCWRLRNSVYETFNQDQLMEYIGVCVQGKVLHRDGWITSFISCSHMECHTCNDRPSSSYASHCQWYFVSSCRWVCVQMTRKDFALIPLVGHTSTIWRNTSAGVWETLHSGSWKHHS